jgi:hypothetical protein
MSRSSDRAQTEPLAALVAVVAVGLGLSLYAGVLDAELSGGSDRELADSAIERVESTVAPTAIALPDRIDHGQEAGPTGYHTNVTLTVDEERWRAGPAVPQQADQATTRLGVRVGPARVRTGILRVQVWT